MAITPGRTLPVLQNGRVSIEAATSSRSISRERFEMERQARRLAWGGNVWHLVEFAIAVGAGVAAGSVALVGFGADSLIEVFSGSVIAWLFSGGRSASEDGGAASTTTGCGQLFRLRGLHRVPNLCTTSLVDIIRSQAGSGSRWQALQR